MQCSGWKCRLLAACILTLSCSVTHGVDVLVVPVDGSHWINMRILIEELKLHGHNITVLHSSTAWYTKEMSDLYQSITVQLQECLGQNKTENLIQTYLQKTLNALKNGLTFWAFVQLQYQLRNALYSYHRCAGEFTNAIFSNKAVLRQLEDANFDLVLTDPAFGTGPMLAYYLKIPLVYNVRWFISGEAHLFSAPSPPSYIPITGSQFTSKMGFLQRIQNLLLNLFRITTSKFLIQPIYNDLCHRYLGPDTDIETVLLRADVLLMRVDFIFEFPRPTMPNIVYIGGFQCKPSKPLPLEFEEFVQSSGDHGIIVMSLGTIVSSLPMHITMQIAEAFAQVPQKVIWRHDGTIPPNIGNNTLLAKWIPQNDLLGHPKTRVFVAHGGTNGVYEAIYHGVPVVGMPLIFDQFDNLLRLEIRGAAKVINVATMRSTDLLQALNEVIHNTSYRENMQKLSALHRDQPETPMERAIFWIEYVARHKGAAHLRSESYRLPWYVYYCVDVMIFLLSLFLIVIALTVVLLTKLCSIVQNSKQKIQ
ncbi:UDP-glucuronosyltransferase 2A1-like [Stegostoma tigrinum]|uniref:UDP-glucuronosyltransferase 2A1-like n=1 Tax=Stegostoma tigrinum TaxID=3053191 RepID=UPI00202B7D08|nr:UDP-glucuronosyltransferase 2A1-like [Stegostoma tigrinum]XP_048419120.1 UDP-glucuronosyltransferase 2A1-like [Stegostoma tigrinum]XP_048419121.1 UDP-glucuronosyltransferase 2A1-like [Stegostoma tigrinum]XP_059495217.1 UDP-glucuronosyltransferase 2A1-like [Stegostoma tigrinum]